MRIAMEWSSIALDWVNCLRLTDNRIKTVGELQDGKFLSEILYILFGKRVEAKNRAQVFHCLKESLNGNYKPEDWISFEDAYEGNLEELVKIVSVIMGVSSLKSNEKLFLERPSNSLKTSTQVYLKKFLESVLENENVIGPHLLPNDSFDKEIQRNSPSNESDTPAEENKVDLESQSQISYLQTRIRDLTQYFESLMMEKENDIQELDAYKVQSERTIGNLNTQLNSIKKSLTKKELEIQEIEDRKAVVESELVRVKDCLEHLIVEKDATIKELEEGARAMERKFKEMKESMEVVVGEKEELHAELERANDIFQEKINALKKLVDEKDKQTKEVEEWNQALEFELGAVKNRLKSAVAEKDSEIRAKDAVIQGKIAELKEAERCREELSVELGAVKNRLEIVIVEKDKEIQEKDGVIQKKIAKKEIDIQQFDEYKVQTERTIEILNAELNSVQESLTKKKLQEIQEIEDTKAEVEAELVRVNDRLMENLMVEKHVKELEEGARAMEQNYNEMKVIGEKEKLHMSKKVPLFTPILVLMFALGVILIVTLLLGLLHGRLDLFFMGRNYGKLEHLSEPSI